MSETPDSPSEREDFREGTTPPVLPERERPAHILMDQATFEAGRIALAVRDKYPLPAGTVVCRGSELRPGDYVLGSSQGQPAWVQIGTKHHGEETPHALHLRLVGTHVALHASNVATEIARPASQSAQREPIVTIPKSLFREILAPSAPGEGPDTQRDYARAVAALAMDDASLLPEGFEFARCDSVTDDDQVLGATDGAIGWRPASTSPAARQSGDRTLIRRTRREPAAAI